MNSIKLHLIYLVMMCVGLCPRVAMAEGTQSSGLLFTYSQASLEIDNSQYQIGYYSADNHLPSLPYRFLFAQKNISWTWWFAVQFKINDVNICGHNHTIDGKDINIIVNTVKKFDFLSDLVVQESFEDLQKNIQAILKENYDVKQDNAVLNNIAKNTDRTINDFLPELFDGCSEFLDLDKLAKENIEKLVADKKITALEEKIYVIEAKNDQLEKDLKNKEATLGKAETKKRDLQEQLDKANAAIEILQGGSEKPKGESSDKAWQFWKNWLQTEALNGLLMIVIVIFGFLFYQNLAQRFDDKIESYNNKKNKSYLGDVRQIINDAMLNFKIQQEAIFKKRESIINPVDRDKSGKQLKPPIETDTEQAKALSKKLDDIDQQIKRFISQYQSGEPLKADFNNLTHQFQGQFEKLIARDKEYNDKLEKLGLDMLTQLKDTKADHKQERERFLGLVEKLRLDLDMQTQLQHAKADHKQERENFRRQEEKLKLAYDKEKDSRLDIQTQLEDAKAGQEQAKESFLRLYQQGGLKLSDEESQNLTPERRAELDRLYIKRPTVRLYWLVIRALKNRLGDSALADEPFFKAVGLNVLKAKLSEIHHFRKFYETDEFSAYLVGHWKDNIQLIFRACLLLENYFQIDMQNPVLNDLQLARGVARKLLREHGLIPDDFQLLVPSHELERKFEVTVHGDIPVDLTSHAGFKDKVQALRRSGAHKVVCYVSRWGLSAQAGAPYTHDLPSTVLKSLERLDPVVRGWED